METSLSAELYEMEKTVEFGTGLPLPVDCRIFKFFMSLKNKTVDGIRNGMRCFIFRRLAE